MGRIVATHISRLTHCIFVAELSTRPQFRNADPDHLRDIASHGMYDNSAPRFMREQAQDCIVIAEAVWFRYMRPHIIKMLVDKWGANEVEAAKVVESYFVDDSPQYDPNPRGTRRG